MLLTKRVGREKKAKQRRGYYSSRAELFISKWLLLIKGSSRRDFPGGTVVKNPPASAVDVGSSPGPGRSHMSRSS